MPRSIAVLAIIALAIVPMALAQEPTPQQPTSQPPRPAETAQPAAEKVFVGEIVSIDANAKTITAREHSPVPPTQPSTPAQPGQKPEAAAGKSMTFSVDPTTEITTKMEMKKEGAPPPAAGSSSANKLELKDLKAGDRVSVKYTAKDGKNVAKSIDLVSRGGTSD